jgi:rhodanese-related sulfurtransferase
MAQTKVSDLTALTTPDGAEELYINDGGTSKKITIANAIIAGTGITKSGATISAAPVALTTIQTAANQSAHLALTAQEGDVVVRSDENKTYMHNGGSAGSMSDYTLMATPTDAVTSVVGQTGVVSTAQIKTALENGIDSVHYVDGSIDEEHIADDAVTADKLANSINTAIAANTAKVTNATHTGDVTGSTTLTIATDAVDLAMLSATGTASSSTFLRGDNTWDVPIGGVTSVNSVTGAVTAANIATAVEAASDSNTFTDADHTKLNGISANATVDQSASAIKTLLEDGIDSVHYVDGSIDNEHIADDAINSEHYAAGSIDNEHLADDAVGVAELSATGTASSSTFLRGDNSWTAIATDANTTTKGLYEHAHTIAANYSITSGNNAMSVAPVTINSSISVTVPTGSTWTIV